MSGGIVEDQVEVEALGEFAVELAQEAQEFLVTMPVGALPDDLAVEDVECRVQAGGAIAFVAVGHGAGLPRLERQPKLSPVDSLDHGLLVDTQNAGLRGRIYIHAKNVDVLLPALLIL